MSKATDKLSIDQLRKYENTRIMDIVKAHQPVLTSFDDVLDACVLGREYPEFLPLRNIKDFCDGFVLA